MPSFCYTNGKNARDSNWRYCNIVNSNIVNSDSYLIELQCKDADYTGNPRTIWQCSPEDHFLVPARSRTEMKKGKAGRQSRKKYY